MVSAGDAFPHARLPALWLESGRTPLDQRLAARRFGGDVVFGPVANDRGALAQCAGGGVVRPSSLARRVGRLGGRAARRSQRTVFHAHPGGLWRVCPPSSIAGALSRRGRIVRLGPHGQADVGDASTALVAARLLALGTVSAGRSRTPPRRACAAGAVSLARRRGQAAAFGTGHCRGRRDDAHPRRCSAPIP